MSASFIPDRYVDLSNTAPSSTTTFPVFVDQTNGLFDGLARRWRRERRRRKVGRAYDMALEIACVLPRHASVLDVGCGNGFIAHHLSALLGSSVLGIDLAPNAEAPINYKQFDSVTFPVASGSVDAILLCYVLHHAQDLAVVMSEMRRVLAQGGMAVVYEDIPESGWDRVVCAIHDRKWRGRTGACRFKTTYEWPAIFSRAGFTVVSQRRLSRWRNMAHPVRRNFYVFKLDKMSPA